MSRCAYKLVHTLSESPTLKCKRMDYIAHGQYYCFTKDGKGVENRKNEMLGVNTASRSNHGSSSVWS
jgi:hypothetical protein